MNISEVSDVELSKWIAEFFERRPKDNVSAKEQGYPRLWFAYTVGKWEDGNFSWNHNDMVNDPAMTVMLMEKMANESELAHYMKFAHIGDEYRVASLFDAAIEGTGKTLGRAVAEAFCLANGWSDKRD